VRFFAALAAGVVRFRLIVIAAWVVALVGATVALPSLGNQVNSDPSLFLASSAPSVQAQTLGAPLLGERTTSKITIVAARSGTRLTSADQAAISNEGKLAKKVADVTNVKLTAVSPSQNAVQLQVTVTRDASDATGLKPVVAALEATFPQAGAPPGLQLHLAGQVADNAANNNSANKSMKKIGIFSALLIIVLLLTVLRSPVAAVITFVPAGAALLAADRVGL
jgi:RND superfamily putative drug exporter